MIEEVFENLVDQFSDPFTFYRELIQNSMDAGSNQVDVDCQYDPSLQRVTITITDSGEGMSEKVIEDQLTRLFSSTKEQDMTKIGKFGIGFVSIFAIQPECVILDTGRDGNYWRVVFPGSTEYLLYRLQQPVEGTQIRLFKNLPAVAWPEFLRRSRETICYWCGYSETQVSFNGEILNQELAVDSPCSVTVTGPGTKAVIGMTAEDPPFYGMYNHGLTLKEEHYSLLPGLTFRIKSNYLEHTLTRDTVIRDKNYHKAIEILNNTAENQLVDAFISKTTQIQNTLPQSLETLEELLTAAYAWLRARPNLVKKLASQAMLPTHHHGLISLKQLKSKGFLEGAIYYDNVSGPVTEALAREDVPVLWGQVAPEIVSLYCERSFYNANQVIACPKPLNKDQRPKAWSEVEDNVREYLRMGTNKLTGVYLADFNYTGSCVQGLPCLAEIKAGQATRLFQRGIWRNLTIYPGRLLLNHKHPLIEQALNKYQQFPKICAYAVSKAALLQDGLPQKLEAKMLKRCWS